MISMVNGEDRVFRQIRDVGQLVDFIDQKMQKFSLVLSIFFFSVFEKRGFSLCSPGLPQT
jgi:hypothetical protein